MPIGLLSSARGPAASSGPNAAGSTRAGKSPPETLGRDHRSHRLSGLNPLIGEAMRLASCRFAGLRSRISALLEERGAPDRGSLARGC